LGLLLESVTLSEYRTAILTLQLGGQIKRVVLDDNYPVELGKLPDLIDRVVGSDRWVGKTK
jgi:hypothetical protein